MQGQLFLLALNINGSKIGRKLKRWKKKKKKNGLNSQAGVKNLKNYSVAKYSCLASVYELSSQVCSSLRNTIGLKAVKQAVGMLLLFPEKISVHVLDDFISDYSVYSASFKVLMNSRTTIEQ